MQRDLPKITIGIPVFNEADKIRECITSIKVQEYQNFKVIISDNNSDDETADVCTDLIKGDDRFHFVKHPRNLGAIRNFGYVFDVSDTEFFMWLGSHDSISSDYLSRLIGLLEQNPEASMAFGRAAMVYSDGSVSDNSSSCRYQFNSNRMDRYLQSVAKLSDCTIVHSVFRRRFLDSFEFRQVISIDHVILSTLLWHGPILYDEAATYFRRRQVGRDNEALQSRMKRITGLDESPNFYNFSLCYLDSFERLYQGDARIRQAIVNNMIRILSERFGQTVVQPKE